jgi:murein endopeptidase
MPSFKDVRTGSTAPGSSGAARRHPCELPHRVDTYRLDAQDERPRSREDMLLTARIAMGLVMAAGSLQVDWHHSTAVGSHTAGRLVHGVRMPAQGRAFFTWDPVLRRSPNRAWRRWGTDRLVRVVLRVARDYHAAHPLKPRMAVGDLSRPHGGDFGPRFGYIGHASHQNGLDVDVYYPRADGRELAPRDASDIDRALSQELVNRFLAAGAEVIFVGPGTGLSGPARRVQPLVQHDNHLHVRLPGEAG